MALALVAIWLGIMIFAARQVGRGRRRALWVFFAPPMAGLAYGVWVAVRSWIDQPLIAIVLGLVTIPSLVLFIRSARQQVSEVPISDPTWKLSSAQFDDIVWSAIGVPLLVVAGLIVALIAFAIGAFK